MQRGVALDLRLDIHIEYYKPLIFARREEKRRDIDRDTDRRSKIKLPIINSNSFLLDPISLSVTFTVAFDPLIDSPI